VSADDRHEHWRQTTGAWVASTYDIQPIEPFACQSTVYNLGPVRLAFSTISGQRFARSAGLARRHGRDEIAFALNFSGEARGDADGRSFVQGAGALMVSDATRSSTHQSTLGNIATIVLPRDAARQAAGPAVEQLHGAVIDPVRSLLLSRHLLTLRNMLGSGVPAPSAERHGRVLTELLALTVDPGADGARSRPPEARRDVLEARAQQEIEAALGSVRLSVKALAARLGVSRATLHRIFEQHGGVEAYIREQRLQRARLLLANLAETDPIAGVADALGFADTAHFSRSFKLRFGESPSAYRLTARGLAG
jgi:AraC-like DNA-binding protein